MILLTGLARLLGLSPRGNSFPSFINSRAMSDYVGGDLRQKIENPVQFQTFSRRRRRGQATRDSSRLRHCPANRYLPSSLRKQPERSRPIDIKRGPYKPRAAAISK
jgi:hypothetical protein